ncbi:MAG TPA: hypothetical protein VMM78_05875 [Thermomicrobiales bacterium]|nr:hypothetical protein [Thermomicrobiales bacterium]
MLKGCLIALALLLAVAGGGVALLFAGYDIPYMSDLRADDDTSGAPPGQEALATVAVEDGDSIQSCMERNMTPELLLSLYRENTTLSDNVIRVCLQQDVPPELVGLMDPMIRLTSQCASETSRTLTTEEVLILGQSERRADKDAVIERMVRDTLSCVAREYDIPLG